MGGCSVRTRKDAGWLAYWAGGVRKDLRDLGSEKGEGVRNSRRRANRLAGC
jgi:hypothetical protein